MGLDMWIDRKIGREPAGQVIYWRKANHVHAWFVKNVQDGVDDCRAHPVTRAQLGELKALCETVLKDREQAPKLLPRAEGFFFGSSTYDKWYFVDLEETLAELSELLSEPEREDEVLYYQSSW